MRTPTIGIDMTVTKFLLLLLAGVTTGIVIAGVTIWLVDIPEVINREPTQRELDDTVARLISAARKEYEDGLG